MEPHNIELAKKAGDYVFLGVTAGAVFDALPELTAAAAFIWWLFRIYELRTVQRWLRQLRGRR